MIRGYFIILLCLLAPLANAGAWSYDNGEGQVIATVVLARADAQFDAFGDESPAEFYKIETSLYWEHGLTDKWTFVLQPTLQDVSFDTTAGSENYLGLGPTEIALRRTLWQSDKTVLSTQGGVIFAGGGENIPDRSLGEGGTDYEARLLLGRSLLFGETRGFAEIQAGYRARSDDLPNEWRLDASLGIRPVENIQLMGQVFAIQSEEATFPNRQYQSVKLQTSLVWDRTLGTSYQFGLYQTVAGETIVKETGLLLSMWERY